MKKFPLEDILPHKKPMMLLDDVLMYNKETRILSAKFNVYPEKLFFDKTFNGINSLVGLEIMAQAIGCYSFYRNNHQKPQAGLLLGTRLFNNAIEYFENGETYSVVVHEVYTDAPISSFDCMVKDKFGNEIQSAGITVCQVDSINDIGQQK